MLVSYPAIDENSERSFRGSAVFAWRKETLLFVAAFCLGAFPVLAIQWSSDSAIKGDGFYHLAIARDYAEGRGFDSRLCEGLLARYRSDREPLFHLMIAALHSLGAPAEIARSLVACLAAGIVSCAIWRYSRSFVVVLCGLFSHGEILYRLLQVRPQGWAVVYVLLGTMCLLRNRHRTAAAINVAYVLSYSVPVVLLAAALAKSIATRKLPPAAWLLVSFAVGILLKPGFPDSLVVLWYQGPEVLSNVFQGNPAGVAMPRELLPVSIDGFIFNYWIAVALLGLSIVKRTVPWWMISVQLGLLALSIVAIRFAEYTVPLIALTAGPTVALLGSRLGHGARGVALVLILFCTIIPNYLYAKRGDEFRGPPIYEEAAIWLGANAAPGEYVFNAEWPSYPEIRYYARQVCLAQGQDPLFVAEYDPERFRLMRDAIEGRLSLHGFRSVFPARYVVARQATPVLRFAHEESVRSVFADDRGVVVLDLGPARTLAPSKPPPPRG